MRTDVCLPKDAEARDKEVSLMNKVYNLMAEREHPHRGPHPLMASEFKALENHEQESLRSSGTNRRQQNRRRRQRSEALSPDRGRRRVASPSPRKKTRLRSRSALQRPRPQDYKRSQVSAGSSARQHLFRRPQIHLGGLILLHLRSVHLLHRLMHLARPINNLCKVFTQRRKLNSLHHEQLSVRRRQSIKPLTRNGLSHPTTSTRVLLLTPRLRPSRVGSEKLSSKMERS